jgi:hypothetical protein
MALPADPNKLLYGIYDKDGWDVTKQKPDFDEYAVFALEDTVDRTYAPFDSIEDEPLYTYKPF